MITDGTKEIFAEMRHMADGDDFALVQSWRFAIAEVFYVATDTCLTGFRPASGGVSLDSYESHMLVSMLARARKRVTLSDLEYCSLILARAREILATMGKDDDHG